MHRVERGLGTNTKVVPGLPTDARADREDQKPCAGRPAATRWLLNLIWPLRQRKQPPRHLEQAYGKDYRRHPSGHHSFEGERGQIRRFAEERKAADHLMIATKLTEIAADFETKAAELERLLNGGLAAD
jgi:hypothetical protein